MTVSYGDVTAPADLESAPLPAARGPVTAALFDHLTRPVHVVRALPDPADDVLYGDDAALALYVLYELHYRGFDGVDEDWEWEPTVLAARRDLERGFLARLEAVVPRPEPAGDVPRALRELLSAGDGPSLSRYLMAHGTLEQFREYAVHRSAYQLKEADPHTWGLPRLTGGVKAAMVEIQADEYGAGVERDMHQNLFAMTMRALGLSAKYNGYLDALPGPTLAPVNLVSFFGLHRRWRAALVGHLAAFEMTSVEPMGRYAAALRRFGLGPAARHFFEVHVVADAHHQTVGAEDLAGGLAAQDPRLTDDILFGAAAVGVVEQAWAASMLDAWQAGRSSLRMPLEQLAAARP